MKNMSFIFSKLRALNANENQPYLIVGLGNPGRAYRKNRHNIGFMLLDRFSEQQGETFSRFEARSLVVKTRHADHRLILAKPQTFMNNSGQSVNSLIRFYKIPLERLLIAYDDVDLPLGKLRLRPTGGSGGHRGMKSIIECLGTDDFPRLRIGIGRPPGRMEAADYVLQDFKEEELLLLPDILDGSIKAILTFITDGIDEAMNQFNAIVVDE
jgi:peptidyl-tRNA hydrolase, PTH1 family